MEIVTRYLVTQRLEWEGRVFDPQDADPEGRLLPPEATPEQVRYLLDMARVREITGLRFDTPKEDDDGEAPDRAPGAADPGGAAAGGPERVVRGGRRA